MKVGGAGNKILEIVKGKVDMYFYPKPNALKRLNFILIDGILVQVKFLLITLEEN